MKHTVHFTCNALVEGGDKCAGLKLALVIIGIVCVQKRELSFETFDFRTEADFAQ